MSSKLAKISKQHENTWAQLHRRLISLPFSYKDVFTDEVYNYIDNQAVSRSSSIGYMVPCLLTSTAFVAGMNNSAGAVSPDHQVPFNLYSIIVGPPTTGKSQALGECALQPLITVREARDLGNFIVERCTSSALTKCLAEQKKGFLCSPEIYDVLNKLLKSDEENGTGDVQLLCELFSGERTSFRYATESTREISSNVPFCIVGSTQVPFAARLVCRMDQGHGLLDRFLVWFPVCFRPSPKETEDARKALESSPLQSFTDLFLEIYELHLQKRVYKFKPRAKKMLDSFEEDHIKSVNESIQEGVPPPKSKRVDLLKRIAVSLHILTYTLSDLICGRKPRAISKDIDLVMVEKALLLLDYAESQKQLVIDFLDEICASSTVVDAEKKQPTMENIKVAVLLFPGPVITKRCFKQSAPRPVRGITNSEFLNVLQELEKERFGAIVKVHPTRNSTKETIVFVKNKDLPENVQIVQKVQYDEKYALPLHGSISQSTKTQLIEKQFL